MKKKDLKLSQAQKFLQAYTEQTRDRINFQGYHVKPSQYHWFEKLAKMYPDFDPYLFMEGVFRDKWFVPDKRKESGYKEIHRPYPNMLVGKKALEAYNRIKRQGITKKLTKDEEIKKEVKDSIENIKQCKIEINDYESLFTAYQDKIISPYYLVLYGNGFDNWFIQQISRRKIALSEDKILEKYRRYFKDNSEIREKLECVLKEENEQ